MSLELIFVRHGETDWNRIGRVQGSSDIALNELGHRQAARLANFLETAPLDAIYVSTSRRAIETAEALTKNRTLIPIQSAQIVEINYGHWEGQTSDQILEKWPQEWADFKRDSINYRPPAGETIAQLHARLEAFISDVTKKHTSGRVAVVSHGGAIGHMISILISEAALAATRIQLANCALSRVVVSASGTKLVSLGETHYLHEDEERRWWRK